MCLLKDKLTADRTNGTPIHRDAAREVPQRAESRRASTLGKEGRGGQKPSPGEGS